MKNKEIFSSSSSYIMFRSKMIKLGYIYWYRHVQGQFSDLCQTTATNIIIYKNLYEVVFHTVVS